MPPWSPVLKLLLLLLSSSFPTTVSFDTSPLDTLRFYSPTVLTPTSTFKTIVASIPSLNAGLWSAANTTRAERPFSLPPHSPGMELVVNTSASPQCTGAATNMSSTGGIATLPTGSSFLGIYSSLTFEECVSFCCSTARCSAIAHYVTTDEGELCQAYGKGYITGPQPFPSGHVTFAQGVALTTPPLQYDDIGNGLRSGTYLGGLGTGGYELRADGTFHLSTIRNQGPASEPWQGTLRDFVLSVGVNSQSFAVALRPIFGLSPVPQLVYEDAFPVAKLQFLLGLQLYAYSPITPGDVNASNTPAVVFTLHVNATGAATAGGPLNVSFVVGHGLGLRNDWGGVSQGVKGVGGYANASACAAACVAAAAAAAPCFAWQFQATTGTCWLDTVGYAQGANSGAGVDSGIPGGFTVYNPNTTSTTPWVVFTTADPPPTHPLLHNALGSHGLFVLPGSTSPGSGASLSYSVAVGDTMEGLLTPLRLKGSAPAAELSSPYQPSAGCVSGLFGAAVASVTGLLPGESASLSIAHAWHFPHYYWYRDSFTGSDNGVRYSHTFGDVHSVVASLNLTSTANTLVAWQTVFSGLPHPLLKDAAANLLSHLRSSMWLKSGEYRQWESLEFTDWANPTNGDERHLPYFFTLSEAMRSQLMTWINHAQNPDGSFYCIIVSESGDAQYGRGDPCAHAPPHPDDISMIMIAAYEQLTLGNDTALITSIYPSLLRALGYYTATYNASTWALPYKVHETYDAVAESASITGEGNQGFSLFNALEYLTGLHCMRGLAESQGDGGTVATTSALIALTQVSIQRNLYLPNATFYVGDTGEGGAYILTEPSGYPYHGSDNLHGQALAYRLGFGDLLPRLQMQLHTNAMVRDFNTSFGLRFDTYSPQNWLMSDHTTAALQLHWNEVGAWDTTLRQLHYFREERRDATRHTAVIDTDTGLPALLNYYGYALFFYHSIHGFTGQATHLPRRTLSFSPHFSAFTASPSSPSSALLPVLLGGDMGTLLITPTSAVLTLLIGRGSAGSSSPLSFLNITICQHVFIAPPTLPFILSTLTPPLTFTLPAPCTTSSPTSASTIASTPFCAVTTRVTDSTTVFSQGTLPSPLPGNTSLSACEAQALAHRFCGYVHHWGSGGEGVCVLVGGGIGCFLVSGGSPPGVGLRTLGTISCDYSSSGYTPPTIVNTSSITTFTGVGFGLGFAPLDSPVFSFVAPPSGAGGEGEAWCLQLAQAQQVCGVQFIPVYQGKGVGSCPGGVGGGACCILNPYKGCSAEGGEPTPGGWGNVQLSVFGNAGVFPE